MVAPLVAAAGISAASSLLGGFFGQKSADDRADQNIQFQKDAAKKSIRWKVRDAKAAGLHPLYAMGAQSFQPTPVQTGNIMGSAIADAGSSIAQGVRGNVTAKRNVTQDLQTKQIHQLQMIESSARAEKDFAQAQLFRSEIARATSRANTMQDFGLPSRVMDGKNPQIGGVQISKSNISDTQKCEDRYGDIACAIWGIITAGGDLYKTGQDGMKTYKRNNPANKKYPKRASAYRDSYR